MELTPSTSSQQPTYGSCPQKMLECPKIIISEETLRSFVLEAQMLPLFELRTSDYRQTKRCSLLDNEPLSHRWQQYLDSTQGQRNNKPFRLPSVNDYHFYNHHNHYAPSQSMKGKDYRLQLNQDIGWQRHAPVSQDLRCQKAVRKSRPKSSMKKKTIK